MLSKLKFEDQEDILRDPNNGAVLNQNMSQVISYKNKKNDINKIKSMNNRIDNLEANISEIKNLLKQLIDGKINKWVQIPMIFQILI